MICLPLFSAADAPASLSGYYLGDADGNGRVDSLDVTFLQRILTRLMEDPDGGYSIRGDVDGKGGLTSIDVTMIMRYLVKLKIDYPIGEFIEAPTQAETLEPTQEPTQAVPTEPVIVPTEPAPTEAETVAPTQAPTAKPDPYELPPI